MTPSSKSADETLMVRRTVCVTVAVVTVMFIKLLRIAAPRGVIWRQRHETFLSVNDAPVKITRVLVPVLFIQASLIFASRAEEY